MFFGVRHPARYWRPAVRGVAGVAFGEADPLVLAASRGSGSPSLIGGSTAHVRVSPDAVGRYDGARFNRNG